MPPQSLLDTDIGDESASQSPLSVRTRRHQLTPRQSERTIPSASSADITPHHKISHSKSIPSKFHISGIGKSPMHGDRIVYYRLIPRLPVIDAIEALEKSI